MSLIAELKRRNVFRVGVAYAIVAWDEYRTLEDDPMQNRPLLAALRFLASPILEGRLAHLTEDALRFVVEGKSPRRLTL
jgi:hypothetical protein